MVTSAKTTKARPVGAAHDVALIPSLIAVEAVFIAVIDFFSLKIKLITFLGMCAVDQLHHSAL